jgi:hypothetical protein
VTEPTAADLHASWSAVLDGLESSVIASEELLRSGQQYADLEPWTAPSDLGPLPAELVERARAIAERQQSVLAQMPAALERTHRQWELTRKITESTATRQASIYIDATA